MEFKECLRKQLEIHPSAQPQDIVKLCYQAAFGAEHLLGNISVAKEYYEKEYFETEPKDIVLYENISEDVCRINLPAWKYRKLPQEWLFKMFASCENENPDREGLFIQYIKKAENVVREKNVSFSLMDWENYLEEYIKNKILPVHHSNIYRENEKPSYRIISRKHLRLLPILEKVIKCNKTCIIAIDGRAASGKTTMARQLKDILNADIIYMDDFFLPIQLRTEERLNIPGGNIHYERFIEEVLPNLVISKKFSYRKFDCGKMDYCGKRIIGNSKIRIVEGSYSCHPNFGNYADITVFSDVAYDEQLQRIQKREDKAMAKLFRDKWIPLEEKYFEAYNICDNINIVSSN